MELVNVDDHDHAFLVRAGTSCTGPFHVSFTRGGTEYAEDQSTMACGQSVTPEHWFVIAKGQRTGFDQPTDMSVVSMTAPPLPFGVMGPRLAPGRYTLRVTGLDINASAPITLVARRKP